MERVIAFYASDLEKYMQKGVRDYIEAVHAEIEAKRKAEGLPPVQVKVSDAA